MKGYYLPPAGIDDFSQSPNAEELKNKWHKTTTDMLDYIRGLKAINGKKNTRVSPLFYDQLADISGVADSDPAKIPWNAFPLRLQKWLNPVTPTDKNKMFATAENLIAFEQFQLIEPAQYESVSIPVRIQDEYCEWHIVPGEKEGSIQKIYFTCEPPEYWNFLAENDRTLLIKLYRDLLHAPDIQEADLFWQHDVYQKDKNGNYTITAKANDYNPNNKWNTTDGAIHLTHPANSLFAEVFLASDSTFGWPVKPDEDGKIDIEKLMCCAGVGGINRSSDPLILSGVYNFAKDNNSVALANPIGLYMMPFQLDLLDPDGQQIGETALNVIRASQDNSKWLRVEVAPPEGAKYKLDECLLSGEPLQYGGQIAKIITMAIFGVKKQIPGKKKKEILSCPSFCCEHPEHKLFKGTFPVKNGFSCKNIKQTDWDQEAYDIPAANAINPEKFNSAEDNKLLKANFEAVNLDEIGLVTGAEQAIFHEKSELIKKVLFSPYKGRGVLPIDDSATDLF